MKYVLKYLLKMIIYPILYVIWGIYAITYLIWAFKIPKNPEAFYEDLEKYYQELDDDGPQMG